MNPHESEPYHRIWQAELEKNKPFEYCKECGSVLEEDGTCNYCDIGIENEKDDV